MKGGDIGNDVPRCGLVALEALASCLPDEDMWLRRFRRKPTEAERASRWVFDPLAIGRLWRISTKHSLRMDLVVFGEDEEFAAAMQERVDKFNFPITMTWHYPSRQTLASALAFMPFVYGVIDDPQYGLAYGGRYMTWEEVA